MIDFVHLHVHTDFSLLDGAASVESLAAKAAALGMKHLAITDHGNMFGVLKFSDACHKHGIHPVIGSEFYMAPGSRFEKTGSEYTNKYYHLILLAKSEQGYRNLIKLSSYSFTQGFYSKPRIDSELIMQFHDGLICLSACLAGEIPSLILDGKTAEAEHRALWFQSIFGEGNFYLELQDHGIEAQKRSNPLIIDIAQRTGIPLVLTNDIHYLEKEDAAVQDILLCISTGRKRDDEKRLRFEGSEFYFKSAAEMAELFPEHPQVLANTVRIAESCQLEIPKPGPLLPDFAIPESFTSAEEYLRSLTQEGIKKRYDGDKPEAQKRAVYELNVIISMQFTGYFLIVADFINWAKQHDIPVGPGRGSGAGSIVAYALGITDIDPLRYNLLFERFLNPERVSMPDFDVDFCYERRGEVIKYVTEKYGQERVGQIITFGTLKARAVIKDVARALNIPLDESNQIAKLVPENPKITLRDAFEQEPKLHEWEKRYPELFSVARKLEGKNRHSSIHASGIVIGKTDLVDYVPLYWDPKSKSTATQFTMDMIEDRGLVKMDFLGLKTLDLIKNASDLIRRRGGRYADFSLDTISETDPVTYKMLGEGKSAGIFQFESGGMQNILRQAQPSRIEDLIALNALYRPGPMDYIPQYIDSKSGKQKIMYPDPCLEPILKETYGVIVYQEQVMQVAQKIAGYTLGQADILRRAMGKKKIEVMVKEKEKFVAGAKNRGFKEADADRIFEILVPFAGYGFNKSHATAYSLIAYQTAYLKANFPAEFMAASLSNEITSADGLPLYIEEARKLGIIVDPPDINRSEVYFSVFEGHIVYGFVGIKGLGEGAAQEIVRCRAAGPYKDFIDFLQRVNIKTIGKKVIEILVLTGAFDCFGMTRATLKANLEQAVEFAQSEKDDLQSGQSSLFDELAEKSSALFRYKDMPEFERSEKLQQEKEYLGFYFSGHPMDAYKALWEQYVTLDFSKLNEAASGSHTVIGIVKEIKTIVTKRGEPMAYIALDDYRGILELTCFPKLWSQIREKFTVDTVVALRGSLERNPKRDRPGLLIDEILDLEKLQEAAEKQKTSLQTPVYHELHIRLKEHTADNDDELRALYDCLVGRNGACMVFIHVPLPDRETIIRAASQIKVAPSLLSAIKTHAGVENAWCA
ncbi:MAG: DNA polymerase III subunit alpha [Spirochaetaceae bacterium]|jgi:DNA polymerase-3 subunit alpha|nr:DNA polymerase III subunit alpha [Spirochaetaceae bacterium]